MTADSQVQLLPRFEGYLYRVSPVERFACTSAFDLLPVRYAVARGGRRNVHIAPLGPIDLKPSLAGTRPVLFIRMISVCVVRYLVVTCCTSPPISP